MLVTYISLNFSVCFSTLHIFTLVIVQASEENYFQL